MILSLLEDSQATTVADKNETQTQQSLSNQPHSTTKSKASGGGTQSRKKHKSADKIEKAMEQFIQSQKEADDNFFKHLEERQKADIEARREMATGIGAAVASAVSQTLAGYGYGAQDHYSHISSNDTGNTYYNF